MLEKIETAKWLIGKNIKDISIHAKDGDYISVCLLFDDGKTWRVDAADKKTLDMWPNDNS